MPINVMCMRKNSKYAFSTRTFLWRVWCVFQVFIQGVPKSLPCQLLYLIGIGRTRNTYRKHFLLTSYCNFTFMAFHSFRFFWFMNKRKEIRIFNFLMQSPVLVNQAHLYLFQSIPFHCIIPLNLTCFFFQHMIM